MKIQQDYVVIPKDAVVIPLKEYDFLREEYARLTNTVAIVKDWLTFEYVDAKNQGFSGSSVNTETLAILLGVDLPEIEKGGRA